MASRGGPKFRRRAFGLYSCLVHEQAEVMQRPGDGSAALEALSCAVAGGLCSTCPQAASTPPESHCVAVLSSLQIFPISPRYRGNHRGCQTLVRFRDAACRYGAPRRAMLAPTAKMYETRSFAVPLWQGTD